MGWTRLTALTACSALLVALGGCGGDPEPKFTKAPSPSTSVSPSPTPSEPVPPKMPAAAKKHTVAGAKAFTRYLWRLFAYAQKHPDSTLLPPLMSVGCRPCEGMTELVANLERDHGLIRGSTTHISNVSGRRISTPTRTVEVQYDWHTGQQKVDYPGKKRDKVYKESHGHDQLFIRPDDDGWVVSDWHAGIS